MEGLPPVTDPDPDVTRRTVLGGVGVACLGTIAGCVGGGGTEPVPDPISIADGKGCDNCTMSIGDHPGPAGQAHYGDPTAVLDEDRPAQFCSTLCTYTFTFDHEDDAEPVVTYLTDYSSVEYEIERDGETRVITRVLEADGFEDASALTMIADSDVQGAMGASMIPFSDADEAAAFREEYGGDEYTHDDVTRELVMSLM